MENGTDGALPEVLTLPQEQLQAIQLERLKQVAVRCYERIPLYRTRFDEAGFNPYAIESFDDILAAPFTCKQDLRDAYPYGMLAVPLEDVREIHMSSGTTGVATVGAYTERDLQVWGECFARGLQFAGAGRGDIAHICYGYGLFTGGLGAHYGAQAAGCTVIPISASNTERQIRVMREMGSTVLMCTPSYAMHIADEAEAMGLDTRTAFKLRVGIHGAEPCSDNLRAELERRFNYTALDVYGLTETMGPGVAMECLQRNGLHLAQDHFFAEIIDPATGARLPEGEWGELVITTLSREASPVFRYRTRDITCIMPGECACGCTHRRIDRLHGRTDDMLIIRGVNVFPSQIEDVMKTFADLSSWYQIVLETKGSLDVVTLRVEPAPTFDFSGISAIEGLQNRVAAALKAALSVSIRVKLVEPKSIERSEGKAVRVIDKREGVK